MLDRSGFSRDGEYAEGKPTPLRHKRERPKLVVHTKEGDVVYGMSFALNKQTSGFHLDVLSRQGVSINRTVHVPFDTLKAVFYVKSFDGRFDTEKYAQDALPESMPVAVEFMDGEVIVGRPIHAHWNEEPRFFIVPENRGTNNLMVLAERSAVVALHEVDIYKKKQQKLFEEYIANHRKPGIHDQEIMGDYYFSRHDYNRALRHYRALREEDPANERLKKKLCVTNYNLGIRKIKQKDYPQAVRFMEAVLKLNSGYEQARHKLEQLREHLAKHPPRQD